MEGRIVYSVSGRDRGELMVITGYAGSFPTVCNGKERRLENPKRKNPKHLKVTDAFLTPDRLKSNSSIRKALRQYARNFAYLEGI